MPTAGIVIIGDEILTRQVRRGERGVPDRRAAGARRRAAADHGHSGRARRHRGDRARRCRARFDHVFTSGGVGPTHDDVTIAGDRARASASTVVRHPELEAKVRGYWKDKLADANLRLADVPDGAELVYGKDQIWPVVALPQRLHPARRARRCSAASSSTSAIGSAPARSPPRASTSTSTRASSRRTSTRSSPRHPDGRRSAATRGSPSATSACSSRSKARSRAEVAAAYRRARGAARRARRPARGARTRVG